MTTPRVTVPVEPTEAMINHAVGHIGGGSTFDTDDRREIAQSVYRAMLSAAPAPEGGAVDVESGTARTAIVNVVERYVTGWGGQFADNPYDAAPHLARELLAALATREEAPAEAGEDDGLFLLMKRGLYYRPNAMGYTGIKDHAGRYTKAEAESHADPVSGVTAVAASDAPDFSPACFDDLARAHLAKKLAQVTRELSALRAPPQAREEAQPFGYWVEHRSGENPVLIRYGSFVPASDHYKITTRYTHPAPDALRVAVEALEAAGRAISAQYALAQAEYQHLDHLATKHDKIVQEGRRAIREALAALQAEQKGGAS